MEITTPTALRVLLVEPRPHALATLLRATGSLADAVACSGFPAARRRLADGPPLDFLVTNVRLGAYNGLHLVHLASVQRSRLRSIVYTDRPDICLAASARSAGAFYETWMRLSMGLRAYLRGRLPDGDRRHPPFLDRRAVVRGGRRCLDH